MKTLSIIDSHTGGEPTRLVLSGGPDLGSGPLAERVARWRQDFDHYRSAIVCEPRGNDVLVGALLCEPHAPGCSAGVIYFNNAGYLGMCGHGTIGLVVSLAHIGKIQAGRHRIDTPVGVVEVELHPDNSVTVHNIPVWRKARAVQVEVPGIGSVTGDIAWGGNWFFLIGGHGLDLDIGNIDQLTDYSWRVRQALHAAGITGDDGAEIDHIELYADAKDPKQADCQNFVLCPGRAYDRSPCGTGTSAKLACLAADGKLAVGASWRQQSITGSLFYGSYRPHQDAGKILPSIRGTAHVTLAGELLLDETDPLLWGIR